MVNTTLARGLRSRSLEEYRRLSERCAEVIRGVLLEAYRGKWTAKRAKAMLATLDGRVSKRAFFSTIAEGNAVSYAHHFVPRVEGDLLYIDCLVFEIHNRHRPDSPFVAIGLQLSPHAVERVFQRLRTVEVEDLQKELRTSVLFALPLRMTAAEMGLRQVPVPTENGTFLCDGNGTAPLFARTWLRDNEPDRGTVNTSRRWAEVVRALRNVETGFLAGVPDADWLLRMAAHGENSALDVVMPRLQEALAPFKWLMEPHVGHPDDERTINYELARAQAQAVNA